jgi:hypothetical protein
MKKYPRVAIIDEGEVIKIHESAMVNVGSFTNRGNEECYVADNQSIGDRRLHGKSIMLDGRYEWKIVRIPGCMNVLCVPIKNNTPSEEDC